MAGADFAAHFAQAASELEDIETRAGGDAVDHLRSGRLFARHGPGWAEFGLLPDVAEAVLRTPGVKPSGQGSGWVRFAADGDDPTVADRARAWYQVAWRAAQRG